MLTPSYESVLVIGKQRLPAFHGASAPATNNPHGAFGTVNTSDTSPGDRAVLSFARHGPHGIGKAYGF